MKKKCYNCKFAGTQFKLGGVTHQHCEHTKHDEAHKRGELEPYDTVMRFSDSCKDHQPKEIKK